MTVDAVQLSNAQALPGWHVPGALHELLSATASGEPPTQDFRDEVVTVS